MSPLDQIRALHQEAAFVLDNCERISSGEELPGLPVQPDDEERQRMLVSNGQRLTQIGAEIQRLADAVDPEAAEARRQQELEDALANPTDRSPDECLDEAREHGRRDWSREDYIDGYLRFAPEVAPTRELAAAIVDGKSDHPTIKAHLDAERDAAVEEALNERRRAVILAEHRQRQEQVSRAAVRVDHQRRPSATIIRPMARRRGAGAPGGPRRRVAATTGGSSDDSSGSSDQPAPIGARAGELADQLIAETLDALRQDYRADLTAHVSTDLPRHALVVALLLVRDELAERRIAWRWAPLEPEAGDDRLRIFIYAERTSK